jgi:peptide/nickel transport system ATP-binding protein
MAVVDSIADRVAVMFLGQIVEMGTRAQVFAIRATPTPAA